MKSILEYPTGLHLNVPDEIYHQRHAGLVSKTALDLVNRAPAKYKAWLDGLEREPTEALEFGKGLHCALLEPARFETDYVTEPRFEELRASNGAGSTKAFKEARAKWMESVRGKQVLDADHRAPISAMVRSIRANPLAAKMLGEGVAEATLRWVDADTGLQCKSRADYYVERRKMVVDIKTTDDASRSGFTRSVVKYKYHVQDALYRAAFAAIGKPIEHFVFVVVEKMPPYLTATYTLDSEGIQRGYASFTQSIATLAECIRNDSFPGYPMTIQTLELPAWAA